MAGVEHRPPIRAGDPPLRIVRSTRRRVRATAFARDGHIEVRLPARLAADEAERTITTLVDRVTRRDRARRRGGDGWLAQRADEVARRWVGGVAPARVTWSSRMTRRWASATPATGEIRISDVAATFPDRVLDYLLVHELAHLRVPDHSEGFHAIVDGYPHAAWARGFLAGVSHAGATGPGPEAGSGDVPAADQPAAPASPASSPGSSAESSPT